MSFDIVLTSGGNNPQGGNQPQGGYHPQGGNQPQGGNGGVPIRPDSSIHGICADQDVHPIHENRLAILYNKLSQLQLVKSNPSPNRGLTMNSDRLMDGLEFTELDRATMKAQIENVYPLNAFQFGVTQKGYGYSNPITKEILKLFKPT